MRKSKKKLDIKKGYKIVRINLRTEKLGSYVLSGTNGSCIEYKQNCWVSQPLYCGPLAVFETLDDARRFAEAEKLLSLHKSEVFALWSCDYIPSPERRLWVTIHYPQFSRTHEVIYKSFPFHHGTRFAQRVRLLNNIIVFQPGA